MEGKPVIWETVLSFEFWVLCVLTLNPPSHEASAWQALKVEPDFIPFIPVDKSRDW